MKTTLLLPALAALVSATPVAQAQAACSGTQQSNVLVSTSYNFLNTGLQFNFPICNGECFDFTDPFNNTISAIDPNDHATQTCTLYDLPNCQSGGAGSVVIGNARVNDLRTLVPNLDKKASSIRCSFTG